MIKAEALHANRTHLHIARFINGYIYCNFIIIRSKTVFLSLCSLLLVVGECQRLPRDRAQNLLDMLRHYKLSKEEADRTDYDPSQKYGRHLSYSG